MGGSTRLITRMKARATTGSASAAASRDGVVAAASRMPGVRGPVTGRVDDEVGGQPLGAAVAGQHRYADDTAVGDLQTGDDQPVEELDPGPAATS